MAENPVGLTPADVFKLSKEAIDKYEQRRDEIWWRMVGFFGILIAIIALVAENLESSFPYISTILIVLFSIIPFVYLSEVTKNKKVIDNLEKITAFGKLHKTAYGMICYLGFVALMLILILAFAVLDKSKVNLSDSISPFIFGAIFLFITVLHSRIKFFRVATFLSFSVWMLVLTLYIFAIVPLSKIPYGSLLIFPILISLLATVVVNIYNGMTQSRFEGNFVKDSLKIILRVLAFDALMLLYYSSSKFFSGISNYLFEYERIFPWQKSITEMAQAQMILFLFLCILLILLVVSIYKSFVKDFFEEQLHKKYMRAYKTIIENAESRQNIDERYFELEKIIEDENIKIENKMKKVQNFIDGQKSA
jgi:hypothetical protein